MTSSRTCAATLSNARNVLWGFPRPLENIMMLILNLKSFPFSASLPGAPLSFFFCVGGMQSEQLCRDLRCGISLRDDFPQKS